MCGNPRDKMAKLIDEVCYDVSIEPNLQPLQSERFENKSTTQGNLSLQNSANSKGQFAEKKSASCLSRSAN